MRHVVFVAKQELKRVSAEGERYRCFGLASSEVKMIEVVWYGLIERRQLGVNQKMVVAGIGLFDTRRRHAHIDKTEANGRILSEHGAILQTNEINPGVGWRGFPKARVNDIDLDPQRHERRCMWNVILVAEKQL
jgi:hypothetical protein